MRVEWDIAKDIENKKKHGISFELASYVFADPNRLERFDRAESNDGLEDRYQTLGLVGKVLFVVYTERQEAYRIITARLANKDERRVYYGNGNKGNTDWTAADS